MLTMPDKPDLKTIDQWEATIRDKQFTLWISESNEEPKIYVIHAGFEGNRFSLILDKTKPTREAVEHQFLNDDGFIKHFKS
jgi:hypothetical protein